MFKKMLGLAALALWLVLLVNGAAVMAQDVCVTEYMANLATPTTVTELRQYLEDIRQVLSECDPVSEGAIEVEVQQRKDLSLFERDENGCYAGVSYGVRTRKPIVYSDVSGLGFLNTLVELKEPGESRFKVSTESETKTYVDSTDEYFQFHGWGDSFMSKGRYEFRYEAFIGADPVILAFEAEHNAVHWINIYCP